MHVRNPRQHQHYWQALTAQQHLRTASMGFAFNPGASEVVSRTQTVLGRLQAMVRLAAWELVPL